MNTSERPVTNRGGALHARRTRWKTIKKFKEASIEEGNVNGEPLFLVRGQDPRTRGRYFHSRTDAVEAFVLDYIFATEVTMLEDLLSRDQKCELALSETIMAWQQWAREQAARIRALRADVEEGCTRARWNGEVTRTELTVRSVTQGDAS